MLYLKGVKGMEKFIVPEMMLLERSVREAAYGPEDGYHRTFGSCCYMDD